MNKTFSKGEIIFREGDNGESFFEVIKGLVGVYTGYGTDTEQKLTEIGAGHIVGELALIDAFPRSATVVALEDTELTEVTIDQMRAYFEGSPDKIKFILGELGERLQRLTDDYTDACVTIRELYPVNEERKPGIADKIKKFVNAYNLLDKSKQPSAEFLREAKRAGDKDASGKNVEKYGKGTIIFREGEPGKCMYDIHFGTIGIYTGYGTPQEKCLTTLYAGKFFGEMALLSGETRTATAVALEEGTMLESIYMDDFEDIFKKNPAEIEAIIKHVSFRIRRLTYEYVNACKMIYDAADAELKNSVSDELKKKAQDYKENYFG
ncbi:cyclic nucleotide-binding domain-containing protein [Butyrivibrio sp. CB08]|uniref:cyclic nucleotide-binding domain-containing protein n=1 Tax=Butyrivibrio sp. CB08 TaxID=2364879 RepID=UPI000EAA3D08|nr:cyclic nucleotide-binding domain-containing protein [Butyrivibrio sp. CB08]RKM61227.1 cyclic nucleotide-binding domain-containing protein [Butyrivibrio sp. CB08]